MRQQKSHLVFETVRERILRGVYPPQGRLPAEQAFCAEFSVGRSTVREAMRMLKANGFVSIRPGIGTTVLAGAGGAPERLRQWLVENRESLGDFMEVRISIESLAVRLFIARFGEAKVLNLAQAEDRFEQAVGRGDVPGMAAGDEAFHTAIALGSENPLLQGINEQLLNAFRQYRLVTFEEAKGWDAAVRLHRKILQSIRLRDTQTALFHMQEHLNNSLENALRSIG